MHVACQESTEEKSWSLPVVEWCSTAQTQALALDLWPPFTGELEFRVCLLCRYAFSIIANLLMFGCFWILLEKMNHSVDVRDLSPDDKEIFWVRAHTLASLVMFIATALGIKSWIALPLKPIS